MGELRFSDTPDDPPEGYVRIPNRPQVESFTGPYYCRDNGDSMSVGFRVKQHHLNIVGVCHGGILAVFADIQGFAMKRETGIYGQTPTIHLSIDYLAPVKLGDWVHATPETQKATRRMQFYSANIMAGDEIVARCSGIYKLSDKNRAEPTDQS